MKRYLLIFALLLGAVCSKAQASGDQVAVLQKCLDLPDLQQYYPMGADQNSREVYVLQAPFAFPAGLQVSKFSKPVQFIDRAEILDKQAIAYFAFRTFSITGTTANVTFDFYYTLTINKTVRKYTLALNKTGEAWTITDTKLNGK